MKTIALLSLFCLSGWVSTVHAQSSPPPPRLPEPSRPLVSPEVQDICFFGEKHPVFVRLHVMLDRRGFRAAWNRQFENRFRELDTDSDDVLSLEEAKRATRINSSTGSTILNSLLSKFTNERTVVSQADTNPKDGKVTKQELKAYLRRNMQGPFHTRSGRSGRQVSSNDSAAVAQQLFNKLDLDDNGKLSSSELLAARQTLEKSDTDEDETLSVAELRGGSQQNVYYNNSSQSSEEFMEFSAYGANAALASRLLRTYGKKPRQARKTKTTELETETEARIPAIERKTLGWSRDLFASFDTNSNGLIEKGELQKFLKSPTPAIELTMRLGAKRKTSPTFERHAGPQQYDVAVESRPIPGGGELFVFGTDQLEFLASAGGDSDNANTIRFFKQQFQFTDRDNNDYLTSGEVRRNYYFQESFARMDEDGDGKVFEKDMLAFLERESAAARTRTLLNIDARKRNLFDVLDTSGDGQLGLRELAEASERLLRWDANNDHEVSLEEIPRQFRLQVTRGQPSIRGIEFLVPTTVTRRTITRGATGGPSWFRKMDTNDDGDISPREFLGTKADFAAIDTDGDALIDATEATNAKSGS